MPDLADKRQLAEDNPIYIDDNGVMNINCLIITNQTTPSNPTII